jgi:hypothetical protein
VTRAGRWADSVSETEMHMHYWHMIGPLAAATVWVGAESRVTGRSGPGALVKHPLNAKGASNRQSKQQSLNSCP